ncbi:hypothetical protein HQ45_06205 [Porphyromonas crevioricanis]|uniref:anthranilate synthase component II n=1 Tax=Porphyromonas crevioricanis TaxID=393921 RepID=UPI00052CBBA6|nr:gamma-glutamyl-gamma-aminobutyrate hydrolase family protein [Porphyromonas crevioricanis]KGN90351.1 hypothetical protein HQ45_06205 [Porphyromonas crevioricanis]
MREVLFIDNHDSFVYNIVELWRRYVEHSLRVCSIDEAERQDLSAVAGVLLSPGPGLPSELPSLMRLIDRCVRSPEPVPLLGICLGHQAIAEYCGGRLLHLSLPSHGMASSLDILCHRATLQGVPEGSVVGRYHSWVVDHEHLPNCLEPLAMSSEDGSLMALRHRDLPMWGLQFHPESIITHRGERYLKNWADTLMY